LCEGEGTSKRGRVNEESKEGWIWLTYFLHMYEYGTSEPVQVILRRGRGKREKNGGNEPLLDIIYVYVEMSQRNSLYNHHILIKTFLKKKSCA
jgi:hypothetical protein